MMIEFTGISTKNKYLLKCSTIESVAYDTEKKAVTVRTDKRELTIKESYNDVKKLLESAGLRILNKKYLKEKKTVHEIGAKSIERRK